MSQEDAIQFVALAKTDESLRPTLLRYSLSRNFAIIADAAERGLTFTKEEFMEAQRGPQPAGDTAADTSAESAGQWLSVPPTEPGQSATPPDETPLLESDYTPKPFDPQGIEFYLHERNRDYVLGYWPKPILRYKGYGLQINIAIAVIFGLVALYCLFDYYRSYSQYAELRDHGVLVEGEVVAAYSKTTKGRVTSQTEYYVTYTYTYEGKEYERDGKVDLMRLYSFDRGDEIMVRVSTKNPDLARLDTENRQDSLMGLLAAGAGGIALLLTGRALFFHLRERRFWGKGQVIAGVAADSDYRYEGHGRHRKFRARIVVRFRSPHGNLITKTILTHYQNLLYYLPKNQTAAIYYVDDQHWWLL